MSVDWQLKKVISEKLRVSIDRVTEDADLIDDLGADSLALAELMAEVEEKLGSSLPADRLGDVITVGDLRSLLLEITEDVSNS